MNLMSRKKRIRWIRNNFCINFGIVPEEAVVVPVHIYIYINIQKVLYKSKFDALSIRTRSIALKRTRSFTNISLGESSPNSAFVPLYKKKKEEEPLCKLCQQLNFEKSRFRLKEEKISDSEKIFLNRNSILSLSLLHREIKQISISSNHETNSWIYFEILGGYNADLTRNTREQKCNLSKKNITCDL